MSHVGRTRVRIGVGAWLVLVGAIIALAVWLGWFVLPWTVLAWSTYFGNPIVLSGWLCFLVIIVLSLITRYPLGLVGVAGIITWICQSVGVL